MLSQQTIDTVKATVPVLEVKGTEITTRFYSMLFEAHPELLNIFNHANQKQGRQQTALANTVYAAAVHIDQLEAIIPAVKKIAHKHRSLGVLPEHYPIVGEYLLKAIKDVLGDAATDDILTAWGEAYGVIADAFISIEKDMYDDAASVEGGWEGFKNFTIAKKEEESSLITSFYLKPADGEKLPEFMPGQYVTVRTKIPGDEYMLNRQYSLSTSYTPDYYRISVKKEAEQDPNGRVSTFLHDELNEGDTLELSVPAGDFFCNIHDEHPLTLISGGVGITPMYSMLKSIADKNPDRPVTFIHAARNQDVRAFGNDVQETVARLSNGKSYIVYEQEGLDGDFTGFINADVLKQAANLDGEFFVCGPVPFMEAVIQSLTAIGIPAEKINFEFFGPAIAIKTEQNA
ncbi:dihydropteridine reductase [Jeotgalibacillus alimentarius]|uniref:Flavohemoprotein n=1 Tax=Jeotgalibacillus alimentarius TaxID=135826 RepID=A0A0C2W3V2_9BACL|nr:NO-inducible flavohemoprotein [Jeotgalibacillus alimentarius]KIL51291.1 dihydropteridine reductase [Jeotgalibacillus alimentarius]